MTMVTMRPLPGRLEIAGGGRAKVSGAQVFARATRHSAQVRFLRRAIPIGVLVAVAGLLAVCGFSTPSGRSSRISACRVSISPLPRW